MSWIAEHVEKLEAWVKALVGHEAPEVAAVREDIAKTVETLKDDAGTVEHEAETDAQHVAHDTETAAEPVVTEAEHDAETVADEVRDDAENAVTGADITPATAAAESATPETPAASA